MMQNLAKFVPHKQCSRNFIQWLNLSYSASNIITPNNEASCMKCLAGAPPLGLRQKAESEGDKYAAVLIPICVDSKTDEVSVLFTRRSGNLSRHVRQISFPGGIKDPTDASYEDCALRETEEEIGLHRNRVQIWGQGALIRPPHTAAIMPVVGLVRDLKLGELKLNPDEVDEAFTIPLADLCSSSNRGYTQFKSGYSSPVFVVGKYHIWGITGFLTNLFLKCLLPKEVGYDSKVKFVRPFKS